jgi:ABC-2 type transport system permease protein
MIDKVFRIDLMLEALAINAVVFGAAIAAFLALLKSARIHGKLIQSGE